MRTSFEKIYLPDITKKDIEALIINNLKRYDLNKKGLASLKSILKPIFDMAYQEYWIKDNPYARMDPSAVAPYALELQLITAFRRSEIPPLKWSDIDG